MDTNEKQEGSKSLSHLNVLVLILSVYVLAALFVDTFLKLPPEVSKLLGYLDDAICVFFIIDFCVLFYYAENKKKFMRWGWIDLVASIPLLPFLRVGRTLRLIRILRILRAFRSIRHLARHIFNHKALGVFTSISVLTLLTMIFCSISILQVEHDPHSTIKTAEDAIWWAFETVTAGSNDKFPITFEGRIIASVLIIIGKVFFVTFMGYIASWFVKQDENSRKSEAAEVAAAISSSEKESN